MGYDMDRRIARDGSHGSGRNWLFDSSVLRFKNAPFQPEIEKKSTLCSTSFFFVVDLLNFHFFLYCVFSIFFLIYYFYLFGFVEYVEIHYTLALGLKGSKDVIIWLDLELSGGVKEILISFSEIVDKIKVALHL